MAPNGHAHFLIVPFPAWGHVRPLLVLATRLVLERDNIIVTMLLGPSMLERAQSDTKAQFEDSGITLDHIRQRIRIATNFEKDEPDLFKLAEVYAAGYPAAYRTLLEEKPFTCATTGTTFDAVSPPIAVLLDIFGLGQVRATREITGNDVPIIICCSSTAAPGLCLFGPEEFGGPGDFLTKVEAEVLRSGRSELEVSEEIHASTTGKIIKVAGMPPIYDYELSPQKLPMGDVLVTPLTKQGQPCINECDGLLITTFDKFESKGSLKAMRKWISELGKDLYGVGPLLPLGYGSTKSVSSRGATDVERFLEQASLKYGQRSVLFISFGSIFWTTNPEYITELVEALVEKNLPFIFAYASPFASISSDLIKQVEETQLGLFLKWTPQQYILSHPAVGWFLTHGGHGGVTEALGSGIPMVCWPFTGDQPIAAIQLSENHGVLIELIEVRNSENGRKPIHRLGRAPIGTREAVGIEIREVIDKLRGEKGREMALNAARLKQEFQECWEEGGDGKTELRALIAKYVDGVDR